MLNKEDIERITENVLTQLRLEINIPNWTEPNTRVVQLKLNGKVLTQASFNVVQKDEYEG